MSEGSGKWKDFFNTKLGRMIIGVIKLSMASMLVTLVNAIPSPSNTNIGGANVPVNTILDIIKAFIPILLIISACKDLDIW